MQRRLIIGFCLTVFGAAAARSASAQGTAADYERADALAGKVRNKVAGIDIAASWSADGRFLWFLDSSAGATTYVVIDSQTGERRPAFDHRALAEALSEKLGRTIAADSMHIERIMISEGGSASLLVHDGSASLLARIEASGAISLHLPSEATEFTLPARPPSQRIRSGNSSAREVHVTFVNQTQSPVAMHWVDAQGQRRQYATIEPGSSHRQHTFAGHAWMAIAEDGTELAGFIAEAFSGLAVIDGPVRTDQQRRERPDEQVRGREPGRNTSPDSRWQMIVQEHNVLLRDLQDDSDTGESQIRLTTVGNSENSFGGRVYWSPDSRYCIIMQTREGDDRRVHLIESSPGDQLQPRLHDYHYRKPGDQIPLPRPWLFDVQTQQAIEIDNALFDNPWSINQIHWAADSARCFFVYNQRGHQVLRLISIDAGSGSASVIVDEQSDTFIDYSNKTFVHHLEQQDAVIWMSERSGWNHLYLVDRSTGDAQAITSGDWVVRNVEHVDEHSQQIRFRLMGVHPGQDPYHIHHARIDIDGGGMVMLTAGDGTHTIEYSPDGLHYVDSYSRVDLPPIHELRRTADGALVAQMSRSDWSPLLETGWTPPERFVATARDGRTEIWGMIIRPSNFDASRRYPVIESIYAGPHGAHVPKSFRSYYADQSLAELGFIVVKIDGMGTNWRSKEFHDVCWKNIADAGFEDRKRWILAAAKKYPSMDVERVGIYGGSAGGQNAMRALLDHHDLYDVAIADCGCHDNRMDKIWWNEAWMGWPVDDAYARSSNVEDAHKLQGRLMLTVGEMDRNVDPASTMQVVDALIRADKDFDLIVFPGGGHGAGGSRYGVRRMRDFFVRHLHGVEPRAR